MMNDYEDWDGLEDKARMRIVCWMIAGLLALGGLFGWALFEIVPVALDAIGSLLVGA